jgi:haloacid dehalogenase superfamily, subfamily IA, variant 3 with third motif having DD or ED
MPIRIPDHVIVFDYGEVISVTPTEADRAELLALAGVDGDRFWPEYWRHRDVLDEGSLAIADYWRGIAAAVGTVWSDAMIHRLWVTDFRSWLSADPGTLDVLIDLRDGGTRMALLSNAGPDFGSYFRHGPLGAYFDGFFVSGELRMAKPATEIFEHVMRELGITPAQTVFIDNKDDNVRAAESLGITGHVFTGAEGLRDFLVSLSGERS